jgi:hypothetical protein
MKEKIEKEVNKLSQEETEKILNNIKGIFKGGVTFKNIDDMGAAMARYYESLTY